MKHSVFFSVNAAVLCLALFVVCIIMVIAGKGVRDKFLGIGDHETKGGVNALLGVIRLVGIHSGLYVW